MIQIQKSCSDLFEIHEIYHPRIPLLNLTIANKKRFEHDTGFGIYFFRCDNELLYVGSYCGERGGVAASRWWTHLASITSRFKETNYLAVPRNERSLNQLIDRANGADLAAALDRQKSRLKEKLFDAFANTTCKADVYDRLLEIEAGDPRFVLNHLIGDGACRTSVGRQRVASERWDMLREMSSQDIGKVFAFDYLRIEPSDTSFPVLSAFLYDEAIDKNKRKMFFQRFIEDAVIAEINPPVNTTPSVGDFTGQIDGTVLMQGQSFVGACVQACQINQ